MIVTDDLEIWNLTRDGTVRSGCVDIFNIVGKLKNPSYIERFSYTLNGGRMTPIYFLRAPAESGRLKRAGEFNIDTINLRDMKEYNVLNLYIAGEGRNICDTIRFRCQPFAEREPSFSLDLCDITSAEQSAQVVDGRWTVGLDHRGRRCLEILPEDAGYDRIVLFGRHDWTAGYEICARLAVTSIVGNHNIGLIFKWNPHEQGDGTWLPQKWSTALGYYCSYGKVPGLRVRFGVGVHRDEEGRKHGDYVLAQVPLRSRWRSFLNPIRRRVNGSRTTTDLVLDRDYVFRMLVHPEKYLLTVWEADREEPPPQLSVDGPLDRLPTGAVGVLALHVGVRLYEFHVRPVEREPGR